MSDRRETFFVRVESFEYNVPLRALRVIQVTKLVMVAIIKIRTRSPTYYMFMYR